MECELSTMISTELHYTTTMCSLIRQQHTTHYEVIMLESKILGTLSFLSFSV